MTQHVPFHIHQNQHHHMETLSEKKWQVPEPTFQHATWVKSFEDCGKQCKQHHIKCVRNGFHAQLCPMTKQFGRPSLHHTMLQVGIAAEEKFAVR